MITLIEEKTFHRMAVKCPECGKIEYFYTHMHSPYNCPRCYLTFPNVMPMEDSMYFRSVYYKSGFVTKNA